VYLKTYFCSAFVLIGDFVSWWVKISIWSFQCFGYSATTNGARRKWILQLDSAHQIGPETPLQDTLIIVENGGKGGRIKAGGIFHFQKWWCLSLLLYNQRGYGQMKTTSRFSVQN